jgi:hypothetical protein
MIQDGQLSDTMEYKYTNEHGNVYVEFHIDEHPLFQDESNHLPFGGSLSIRKKKEEKPVMILGQDECIFKQFSLNKKSWTDPNGIRALLPKDERQGVMISAFTCRELGFGMELSPNQLHLVKERRKRAGKKYYLDKKSAMSKNGTKEKPKLTSLPFICYLDYGTNNDGY